MSPAPAATIHVRSPCALFPSPFTLRPILGILPLPRIQISRQAFYGAQV